MYIKAGHGNKIEDITGQRFGNLTVLGYSHSNHGAYWRCRCDCGKEEVIVNGTKLKHGRVKSCGCLAKEKAHSKLVDLTGKIFGRLEVQYYNREVGKWHCLCECGNEVEVVSGSLKSGRTQSCGCIHKEKMHENFTDLTGKTFNNLLVEEFSHKEKGKYYWNCKCLRCGKRKKIERSKLGVTQTCGCIDLAHDGSKVENEIKEFITSILPNAVIEKAKILDGKEIDIYLPEYKFGIEYNGSAYHATENGVYENKDKYYHRDKFLLAKEKGIHLMTIFDKDYEENKWIILDRIKHILKENKKFFIPYFEVEYTDNDYDMGEWIREYGYKEIGQVEPESFTYDRFTVYRCGKTKWKLDK